MAVHTESHRCVHILVIQDDIQLISIQNDRHKLRVSLFRTELYPAKGCLQDREKICLVLHLSREGACSRKQDMMNQIAESLPPMGRSYLLTVA